MGLGSSASATVRIEIIILNGRARRQLDQTTKSVDRTTRSLQRAGRRFGRFRSVIGTVTKALLSMVAVLIAFNLLITLPQRIFSAFVSVLRKAIATVSLFEQRILALQAILATTIGFEADPLQNFIVAGRVAAGVVEQLALRANEMVVNLEEAVIVFQTLVATGAQEMVEDMDQLVNLTILLANSIAGITVGQQRQRQLAEETRSLMTGQLRATSLLGRLLFSSSTELKKFNQQMRISRTLSTEIEKKLLGFSLAARDFARTFEGLKTTMETFLQLLAKRALGGIFEEAEDKISAIFDAIRDSQSLFNLLAASIAASFRTVSEALLGIVGDDIGLRFKSVEDFLLSMIQLVPVVTGGLLSLIFQIRNFSDAVVVLVQLLRGLLQSFNFIIDAIINVVRFFRGDIGIDELLRRLVVSSKAIGDSLVIAGVHIAKFMTSTAGAVEAQEKLLGFTRKLTAELARIREEQRLLEEAQRRLNALRRTDLQDVIDRSNVLLKSSRIARTELSTIREIIRLSRSGQLSRLTGFNLVPNVGEAQERAVERIRSLGKLLREAQIKISEGKLPGAFGVTEEQVIELEDVILKLKSEINATAAEVIALDTAFATLASTTVSQLGQALKDLLAGDFMKKFVDSFKEGADALKLSLAGIVVDIVNFLKTAELVAAVGNQIALAFENVFRGVQSFGQTMKDFLAELLISIGQAVIAMGVAAVAAGALTLNGALVARGLVAIAAGAAAIAAGVAVGGGGGGASAGGGAGGGEVPTFLFNQELINVQQSFALATERLDNSSAQLAAVTNTFKSMPPSEVITTGNDQLGGAGKVLVTDLKKGTGLSAGRDLALTLKGG